MEPTLPSVLSRKLAEAVDGLTLKQLTKRIGLGLLAGVLSASVIDVQASVNSLVALGHWHNSAVTKTVVIFLLVFHGAKLAAVARRFVPKPRAETIEGIPTVELLDHLFTEKSLKTDAWKKFGVPQYRVERLAKSLKRVGVLTTGENNASVLDAEFSRQDVAKMLSGVPSARDIRPLFRKESDHCYTSRPSATEIRERVDSLLSPARGFTSRPLATAS